MKSFPVIFVSHGAPTLVLEEGATQSFLQALGAAGERAQGRKIHHAYNYGMLSMAAYRWDV